MAEKGTIVGSISVERLKIEPTSIETKAIRIKGLFNKVGSSAF